MYYFKKLFSSYPTMLVLLAIFAVGLAAATFVENSLGTTLAKTLFYYSPWLFFVQLLLVANFLTVMLVRGWWKKRKIGFIVFHLSFIVILTGAVITHFCSEEGELHLREGEIGDRMRVQTNHGEWVNVLPFQVELVKFTLQHYPGSSSPSSFSSDLKIHSKGTERQATVGMNKVLDVNGYRFFQASYDSDGKGTVLLVNKDVAGRNVTYAGYLMLLVGGVLCLVGKNGRIRHLIRQLGKPVALAAALFLAVATCGYANTDLEQAIPALDKHIDKAHAMRFGALAVRAANGRVIPMNTFASEILRKLHKETTIAGMSPDAFLLSALAAPDMWAQLPFIAYANDRMSAEFGLTKKYCSYNELFNDDASYKLQQPLEAAYAKLPTDRTAFDKEIIKLDEKANIMHQLIEYKSVKLFPDVNTMSWYAPGDDLSMFQGADSLFVTRIFYAYIMSVQDAIQSGDWGGADELLTMIATYQTKRSEGVGLDESKIARELRYNRLNPFRWCKIGYLSLGGLMLVLAFALIFNDKRWLRWLIRALGIVVLIVFHFHMLGMAMRWQIGGYAPWSNSYETMVYVAWATVLVGLIFARRSPLTFALATLFAGIIMFVSNLNWMDPQINYLAPVLNSPWLMFHVAVLMAAYGFFGVSCLIGITNMVIMSVLRKDKLAKHEKTLREMSVVNELSLWIGLILMTFGTFMGAVWANETWGRYWGWDPKETWALITIIVYVMVTHLHLLKRQYNLWIFNLCSVVAFASVLMTYFGVNYFLSGLHSYGNNGDITGIFAYLYAAAGAIVLLSFASRKGKALK